MGDRVTQQQRRVVASLMEVYGSPTVVHQKFAERFAGRDPSSRLTIYRVYAKFVRIGSVADGEQVETVLQIILHVSRMFCE
jgi:Fe2+ or Zn2+ uptake regulation protein